MAMLGNKKAAKVALNISEPRKRLLREVDRLIEEGTLLVSLTAFPMLRRGVGAYMYECMVTRINVCIVLDWRKILHFL